MNVLLIDSTHLILEEKLRGAGHKVIDGTTWSRERVLAELHQFEGAVIRSRFPIDESFFKAGTNLKCIGRFGAGLENIDLRAAEQFGVSCLNAPEGNRQAVGEHALGLLLNLMNHIRRADAEVRQGLWRRHENTGFELSGKKVGIIGLGNMGRSFAKVLSGFDANLIACDPYVHPWPDSNIEQVSLEELQEKADIISLHVPLTEDTRHMIDDRFWQNTQKSVFFINTARGPVVDTEALLTAIERGKVLGAGLDVNEFESNSFKLDTSENPVLARLIESENVLLTPHIAGWTAEAFEKMATVLADKMIEVLY